METLPEVQHHKTDTAIIGGVLTPNCFEGLYRISKIMSASGMMPKGVQSVEAVFTAIQLGMEVGLSPMQAVQSVAVIGGRPSIWGDTVLALVRRSGLLTDFDETITGTGDAMKAICTAIRKGQSKPIVREFSVTDAKAANLWGKDGPWRQYPKRMLQMRARSWALRDGFGDVLKGLRCAEEVADYDVELSITGNGSYAAVQQEPETPSQPQEATDHKQAYMDMVNSHYAPNVPPWVDLDSFVEHTAQANGCQMQDIFAQACLHSARFLGAFEKWQAKQASTQPESDPEPPKKESNGKKKPVSFTPEYKALMTVRDDMPDEYKQALENTGLRPDTIENVAAIQAEVSRIIDAKNDLPEY